MKQAMMKKTGENDDDVRKREKLNKNLRKTTIFKKAKELSTLCGVDVAVILYDHGEQNPQTWSSQPDNFAVVNQYLSLNNQPNIVIEDESRVLCDRQFIDSLGVNELNRFASLLAAKIEGLNQSINTLRGSVSSQYDDSQLASLGDADLNLDDVEFTFDSLDGFDFDDLGFGEKSSNDQVEQVKSHDVDFSFGLGMNNMNDQFQLEPPCQSMSMSNSLGDLEYVNDDALDGFNLDDLRFGNSSSDQMILKETQSEFDFRFLMKMHNDQVVQVNRMSDLDDFGYDMENTNHHQLQLEATSQLTSEYSSLADLKFVDDDFDWMKGHALMSC